MWLDFPYAIKKKKNQKNKPLNILFTFKRELEKKKIFFPAQEEYCIG